MKQPNKSSCEDDDVVQLWTREETPMIEVPITDENALKFKQHISDDERWVIYSTVWDGGVGTLACLVNRHNQNELINGHETSYTLILDIGSGTGIVGIGMALLGYSSLITDLAIALPLRKENIELNQLHVSGNKTFSKLKCNATEFE